MRNWQYKCKEIKDRSDLPEKAVGIVYKIHNLKEDKYYDPRIIIGRALEDVEYDSGTVMAVIGVK